MMRTSLKKPACSNRDCVATSEAKQTSLNEHQTLWSIYYRNHCYNPHLSTQSEPQQDEVQKREKLSNCDKLWQKNTHLEKTVSLPIQQGPEA